MKRIIAFLLASFICLMAGCAVPDENGDSTSASSTTEATTAAPTEDSVTTVPPEPEKEPEPLLAGFAERDFTPTKKGGSMPGSSGVQTANGVTMPLFTNAAAFESGDTAFILVSVDILRFTDYGVRTLLW